MRRSWKAASVERWPIETIVVSGSRSGEHPVDRLLRRLVERRGGLVEEEPVGLGEQRAGDGEALLLAAGQPLGPVVLRVEPVGEMRQAGGGAAPRGSPRRRRRPAAPG